MVALGSIHRYRKKGIVPVMVQWVTKRKEILFRKNWPLHDWGFPCTNWAERCPFTGVTRNISLTEWSSNWYWPEMSLCMRLSWRCWGEKCSRRASCLRCERMRQRYRYSQVKVFRATPSGLNRSAAYSPLCPPGHTLRIFDEYDVMRQRHKYIF